MKNIFSPIIYYGKIMAESVTIFKGKFKFVTDDKCSQSCRLYMNTPSNNITKTNEKIIK